MIELSDWLRNELVQRAKAEAPQEACGLISRPKQLLRPGTPRVGLWAAENIAAEPETSFLIAPEAQVSILEQMWGRGEDLAGIYHSHPRTSPEPSDRDRAIARTIEDMRPGGREPLTWIIVGLPRCPHCNGEGHVDDVEPDCCGNTTSSGECRGDCAVPKQVQVPCASCGEWGYVPAFWVGALA